MARFERKTRPPRFVVKPNGSVFESRGWPGMRAAEAQALADAAEAARAAAADALGLIGDDTGMDTTTATDRNLNPVAMPAGWSAASDTSTKSDGTADGRAFARSTAIGAGTGTAYHGVRTTARPPLTPGEHTQSWITAQVRSTTPLARLWVTWLTGTTAISISGDTTDHPVTPNEWTTLVVPVTIPAAADNYRPAAAAVAPYAAGDSIDVRDVGLITSDRGYFDGDTPDSTSTSEDRDHAWDGTAGASTSTRVITTRTPTGGLGGRTVIKAILDLEAGSGGVGAGAVVPPPDTFNLRRVPLPTIYRDGARYRTDVDALIDDLRPAAGVTYYISPTGGGDGTSAATPTTLDAARAKADVGTIIFAPGEYDRAQAYVAGATSKSINYLAAGPGVRVTGWSQPLTWTLTGGNVYQTTRTATVSIGDPRVQHSIDGVIRMYPKVGTTAASVTGPGQWATDGTTVWAWALGNTNLATAPTTLRVGMAAHVGIMHSGGVAYVEGIAIEGHNNGTGLHMEGGTLILRDCSAQGAASNGVTAKDALVVSVRTDASANGLDGFNYHESSGQCDFIEVDCTARRNGWTMAGNCNGSTSHEDARGVRVGGRYADTNGPLVVDVGSAQTWTVGSVTERTDPAMLPSAPSSGHYHADGTAVMWVQDADISGDGTAWVASGTATLHTRNPRRVATSTVAQIAAGSTLDRY